MWCHASLARSNAARCGSLAARRFSPTYHRHLIDNTKNNRNTLTFLTTARSLQPYPRRCHDHRRFHHTGSTTAALAHIATAPAIPGTRRISLFPGLIPLETIQNQQQHQHRQRGNQAAIARIRRLRCYTKAGYFSSLYTLSNAAAGSSLRTASFGNHQVLLTFGDPAVRKVGAGAVLGMGTRQLSYSGRQRPPPPSNLRKAFAVVTAGAATLALIGVAVIFGAVFLALLPFMALGFYLWRRGLLNRFQSTLRKTFGQSGGGGRNASGTTSGEGGAISPGTRGGVRQAGGLNGFMDRVLSSVMNKMVQDGMDALAVLPEVQREVTRRSLRNMTLSKALGGEIKDFGDLSISHNPATIEVELSFVGKQGIGGKAVVEGNLGEDDTGDFFVYEKVVVTLNNGLTFDLSDDDEDEDLGGGGRISKTDDDRPIEAEFKDKQ